MLEFIKSLILIQANADTVLFNIKWMGLWPLVLVQIWMFIRTCKSFIPTKRDKG